MIKTQTTKGRATLKEVAREVGVSICTASVVLNGSASGSRISQPTRDAVVEAAQRLGYRANQVAQSLNAGRTNTIGIIPAAADTNILLGPHLQHVLNGVVNEAESHGYDLSLITRCDQSNTADLMSVLLGGRLDGVIVVAPRTGSRLVPLLLKEALPMVVIDGDPDEVVGTFMVDNRTAVLQAMAHLRDLGHRNVGHLAGDQALYEARIRKDVFFEAVEEFGMRVEMGWIGLGQFQFDAGAAAMRRILGSPTCPTAVFCANDEMALGAMREVQASGLRVPEDIAIVGFDDVPLAPYMSPSLTTVRQPTDEIARSAMVALLNRIERGQTVRNRSFPGSLIVRGSTDMRFSAQGLPE